MKFQLSANNSTIVKHFFDVVNDIFMDQKAYPVPPPYQEHRRKRLGQTKILLCTVSSSNATTEEMLKERAKLRGNILEWGAKVEDLLQQFIASKKENEHKMEAS